MLLLRLGVSLSLLLGFGGAALGGPHLVPSICGGGCGVGGATAVA